MSTMFQGGSDELFRTDNCEYSDEERNFLNTQWFQLRDHFKFEGAKLEEQAKAYFGFIEMVYPNIYFKNVF